MSRIGKLAVSITDKNSIEIKDSNIRVIWALGELSFKYNSSLIRLDHIDNEIRVIPLSDEANALWWTTRAIISNMVNWVNIWYKKSLEIVWVGYKFEIAWDKLILSIGYSHKLELICPKWLKVELDEKIKNLLHITWIDKQLVWQFSAKIRSYKKPEPYKWKWIKYLWEQIRRKAWKTGSK